MASTCVITRTVFEHRTHAGSAAAALHSRHNRSDDDADISRQALMTVALSVGAFGSPHTHTHTRLAGCMAAIKSRINSTLDSATATALSTTQHHRPRATHTQQSTCVRPLLINQVHSYSSCTAASCLLCALLSIL